MHAGNNERSRETRGRDKGCKTHSHVHALMHALLHALLHSTHSLLPSRTRSLTHACVRSNGRIAGPTLADGCLVLESHTWSWMDGDWDSVPCICALCHLHLSLLPQDCRQPNHSASSNCKTGVVLILLCRTALASVVFPSVVRLSRCMGRQTHPLLHSFTHKHLHSLTNTHTNTHTHKHSHAPTVSCLG